MDTAPVWFITGCSTGLGRAMAQRAKERGFRVVATARNTASLSDLAEGAVDRFLALELDVTKSDQIKAAVDETLAKFGRIDVLVNNAGYGYQSTVEEGIDAEIRAQFDTNVFGLFALTRAVLPIMRRQRSGNILNITSVAGFIGYAGSGYYAASKHALEGWTDSLRAELEPLGIGVTAVEPGPFRTDWAGRSLRQTRSKIDAYAETAGKRLVSTRERSGTQAGDPLRAADAMIEIAKGVSAPRHLVLGVWGFQAITQRLQETLDGMKSLQALGASADFPK